MTRPAAKALLLGLLGVLAAGAVACGGDDTQKASSTSDSSSQKVKVGLVLPCPTNDQSWCQQAHQAAKGLADKGAIDLKETANAPQDTAGASQVIAQYAQSGSQLVIAHSAWQDAALDAAGKIPDADIAYAGGGKTDKNVATYEEPIYEGAYLAGMLAAGISKTGTIGGLAGQDVPLCHAELEAFRAGAERVDKKIKVRNSYVGDWNDIAKGKEAALALADQKADVMIGCGGGPASGMAQAVKERGLSGFGYVADQSSLAPKQLVGSIVYDLSPYFQKLVDDVRGDRFRPGKSYNLGLAEGGVKLALNQQYAQEKIPDDVMQQMEKVQTQIRAGSFKVPYTPE